MNFKQKKKISQKGTIVSRAAFFIPEHLLQKYIQPAFRRKNK